MSFYNPDQHTEPQQGLAPYRSLEELLKQFITETKAKDPALKVSKYTIRLWEQWKAEKGVGS